MSDNPDPTPGGPRLDQSLKAAKLRDAKEIIQDLHTLLGELTERLEETDELNEGNNE